MILKIKKFFKSYTTPPPDYYIITNTLKWCYTHNDSTPEEEWKYRWGAVRAAWKDYNHTKLMKIKNKWMHENDPELVFNSLIKSNQ